MNWVRRCAGLVLGGGLAVAGCGMPGAPLPPSLNLPNPVTDLVASRTGDQIRLTWTMPKNNTDKLLLKDKVEVRVCRREGAAGQCAEAGELEVAPGAAGSFSETLPEGLRQGAARPLSYFVELRNDSGRSAGLSNAAVVLAGEAPGPVTGLEAKVRKAGVVLRWSATGQGAAATAVRLRRTLLSPQTEKANAGKNGAMGGVLAPAPEVVEQNLLVEAEGQTPDRALDKDIGFGETYEYRAQQVARVKVDGETLELDGALSAPLRVEVRDVFPPAVPTGLAAVAVDASASGGGPAIDLSWQPDTEADLAGYVVYRREGNGDWMRISPSQPVVGPAFHDAHVEAGHSYSYAVSAIDQSGHESGRSGAAMETVPGP